MSIWSCPRCPIRISTTRTPYHRCAGMAGLHTPLVHEGTKCKIEAVERGDYIGTDAVPLDDTGRPVMAVVTTRDDGQDCTVYAPTATADQT